MKISISTGSSICIANNYINELQNILKNFKLEHFLDGNILNIPQGYIGFLAINDLEIEVQPSVKYLSSMDYIRLLDSQNIIDNDSNSMVGTNINENLDYIAKKFNYLLIQLCNIGLPKKYIKTIKYDRYISGNIEIPDSYIRYCLNQEPTFKIFKNDLSRNNSVNRIIKQAYLKLKKINLITKNATFERIFANISEITHADIINCDNISFAKHEKILLATYEFAKLIIKNISFTSGYNKGNINILINSNDLYEKYLFDVLNKYVDNIHFEYHKNKKIALYYQETGIITSIPDIVYKGLNPAIIDAKNKNIEKFFNTQDFYQLYTYCSLFGTSIGCLIYPTKDKTCLKKVITPLNSNLNLYAIGIPIGCANKQDKVKAIKDFCDNVTSVLSFN